MTDRVHLPQPKSARHTQSATNAMTMHENPERSSIDFHIRYANDTRTNSARIRPTRTSIGLHSAWKKVIRYSYLSSWFPSEIFTAMLLLFETQAAARSEEPTSELQS